MTWAEHLDHLEKFIQTICESGLTLNLKKCSFARSKASFVGHVAGSGVIEPDFSKISTLDDIQPPQTQKKDVGCIKGFFSYFRNFMQCFGDRLISDSVGG